MYEKRRKHPIKVVLPETVVQQQSQSSSSLGCDGTAIARGSSKAEDEIDRLIQVCP